uniref:Uncharacterized protein n=1 Tax=Globodera rostochiensis TaxID=31243 RepID=A0A914HRY8_GLORO
MLRQLLSSPSPATTEVSAVVGEGAEKAGDGHYSSGKECGGGTIVVQEGEERREYILLTRMQPTPPYQSSPDFSCPSNHFFAYNPPECHFAKRANHFDSNGQDFPSEDDESISFPPSPSPADFNHQRSPERSSSPRAFQPSVNRICPSCNRHISNLNGDIRRHVSQCQRLKKLNEAKRSNDNLSPASVDPSDPYQCRWCQFNTLYKGNMKRHLVTCHQVSVNVLARVHFDVERLRKCSGRRPIWDELPIQPRRDGRDDGCVEEDAGAGEGDAEAAGRTERSEGTNLEVKSFGEKLFDS